MPTATRGAATLILLGALLAQAPLAGTAAAYQPRDPSARSAPVVPPPAPASDPTSDPTMTPTAVPTSTPSVPPEPDPTAADDKWTPVARSWSELAQQVEQTSPNDQLLRATAAGQSTQVMRCFKLDEENYCLGLGFVDQVPTGGQISAAVTEPAPDNSATGAVGVEQDIATGDHMFNATLANSFKNIGL